MRTEKQFQKQPLAFSHAIRYWLVWALLLAAIAYGFHRYLEYRDVELEKRLERLK